MIPLCHSKSNRRREYPEENNNSLMKKSSRPPMSCKSLPYNGSSSCYMNTPPPIMELPPIMEMPTRFPPPRMDYQQNGQRQPTILSLQQPSYGYKTEGPFLVPPPPSASSLYRRKPSSTRSHVQGWPMSPPSSPNGFRDDPASPGLSQVLSDFRPGPKVSWYCEKTPSKPKKTSRKKFILSLIVLLAIGYAGYEAYKKDSFKDLKIKDSLAEVGQHIMNSGIRDAYSSILESEWLSNFTDDIVSWNSLRQGKKELPIPEKINADPGVQLNFNKEVKGRKVIYSYNDDMEATVEVVND